LLARGNAGESVDAYAVQHPGVPGRRAVQSVGAHLMWLCLLLERGVASDSHAQVLRRILAHPPPFVWLPPPAPNGTLTVRDVRHGLASPREWAEDVWRAWSPHHGQVRAWADAVSFRALRPG
jgi:Family of unknown function (DUF5946)